MSLFQERTAENAEEKLTISSKQLLKILREGEGFAYDRGNGHYWIELKDED